MGYAMDRHGLAKRFALWFMSLKAVNGSANRTAFGFMLVTGLISMMPASRRPSICSACSANGAIRGLHMILM